MEKSPYLFDPVAWRLAMWPLRLSRIEQAIFREMWDTCWLDGSIPSNKITLCAQLRVDPDEFDALWTKIHTEFTERDGRLYKPECEADRKRLEEVRTVRAEAGRKGAAAKAKQKIGKRTPKAQPVPVSVSVPAPVPVAGSVTASTDLAASRPPDEAFDLFASRHQSALGSAYIPSIPADFVQLSKLRKANGVSSRASPDGWSDAIENYFASPFDEYTICYLVKKFAVLKNSVLDRYGKPVNHAAALQSTKELQEARDQARFKAELAEAGRLFEEKKALKEAGRNGI